MYDFIETEKSAMYELLTPRESQASWQWATLSRHMLKLDQNNSSNFPANNLVGPSFRFVSVIICVTVINALIMYRV